MTYRSMTGTGGLWRPRRAVATGYSVSTPTAAEMAEQNAAFENSLPGSAAENAEESSQKSKQLLLVGGLGILVAVAGVIIYQKAK